MIGRSCFIGLAVALALTQANLASAQDRPTNLIVSAAPGGGTDLIARIIALQESTRKFVVVNKPGAGNILGAQFVAEAKPDGATLLVTGSTIAVPPDNGATFNAARDITPIMMVGVTPYVLVVNSKIPANDPKELVTWIKTNPGKFQWGTAGGATGFIVLEQFHSLAGFTAPMIPYSGTGPALIAVMSGEVSANIAPVPIAKSQITGGQIKALGLMTLEPMDIWPGMKTVASYGFPGLEAIIWYGVFGPKDMPQDVVKRIHGELLRSLSNPAFAEKLSTSGVEVKLSKTPEEFVAYFKSETDKYTLPKTSN